MARLRGTRPGNSPRQMSSLVKQLDTLFSMKDLGPLNYLLGVEVKYFGDKMHLNQAKCALDLLKRTKNLDAKPISTLVLCSQRLSAYDGEPYDNPEMYRSVVGALQYLTITRPDIFYAINQVSAFISGLISCLGVLRNKRRSASRVQLSTDSLLA
ncbi:uncharacterized mitochondrial protein AtMg00810-like [Malus sylvestris]|uniref:uncharacterized mitochondrial protein AtMg00810-like n=1 Tax=Malus domestica TaxID=3750 RepID=UPI0010A9F831|nr:uncharacterized protein LOC108172560 [Malus domestica]XP_050147506.1 uncharacterized mitochondrial protein AtMg00810-like [Malus sylvestris]